MRVSDLSGKEVINLGDGARLGIIEECELSVDCKSGRIHAILLPNRSGFLTIFSDNRHSAIPWRAIKRIGDDVIIVDISNAFDRMNTNAVREKIEDTY
ncbi:MAG: YlmC/YmxH family sporulation protein [Veillonellales bacterium]